MGHICVYDSCLIKNHEKPMSHKKILATLVLVSAFAVAALAGFYLSGDRDGGLTVFLFLRTFPWK